MSPAATATLPRRLLALVGVCTLVLSLFAVLAGPAGAQEGQQGDVKIHEGDGEPDPIDKNEPKVCTFHLHGFNFNDDEPIVWWIEAWEGGDATYGTDDDLLSSEVTANEEGEWRDPQSGTYSLPPREPGNDYRLFWDRESVDADDPDGPPTKHKNFDVECAPAATTTTTTESTTTTTAPTTTTTESTTTTTSTTVPGPTTPTAGEGDVEDEVLGTVVTSTPTTLGPVSPVDVGDEVLGTTVEAEELPFTGIQTDRLIGLAIMLLGGGLLALRATPRREEI